MLPSVGTDQAERIELSVVMMKAALPTRERQPGLLQGPCQHSSQPSGGVKREELGGPRASFEKRLTGIGLRPSGEAVFKAATFCGLGARRTWRLGRQSVYDDWRHIDGPGSASLGVGPVQGPLV
jgi:hypothetical protein